MNRQIDEYTQSKIFSHMDRFNELVEGKDVFPITVEMNITNRCNYSCGWCSEQLYREASPLSEIPWWTAVKAMVDMHRCGVRSVTIEGGGEPTLHKDFAAIVAGAPHGLDLGLITNGSTLALMSAETFQRFSYVRVSLDAAGDYMYAKVHGLVAANDTANLEAYGKVMTSIARAAKRMRPGQVLGVSYIVSEDTVSGVVDAVRSVKAVGATYIQFKPLLGVGDFSIHYPTDLSWIEKVKAEDDPLGFRVYLSRFGKEEIGKPHGVRQFKYCRAHRLVGAITATGDVVLCCNLKHKYLDERFVFGNIRMKSYEEIWKSEERHKIVAQVEGSETFVRDVCTYCRMNEFNDMIEEATELPEFRTSRLSPLWRFI